MQDVYRYQRDVLARAFDALDAPDELITRDRVTRAEEFGGFLALSSPHAGRLKAALLERGVLTDSRGTYLRFGPAPYLTDEQLESAVAILGGLLPYVQPTM